MSIYDFFKLTPHKKRIIRRIISPLRRIGIKKEFTIISNNCWGGRIYDKFGLKYLSPTVGLKLNSTDYAKFLSKLDYYLNLTPVGTDIQQKIDDEHGDYFAKLDDIVIDFVHYKNVYDGIRKWEIRKKRINLNNIIVKMSYNLHNNQDDDFILSVFSNLPYKKILFTCNKELLLRNDLGIVVIFPNHDEKFIINDEIPLSDKLFNLNKMKKIINM